MSSSPNEDKGVLVLHTDERKEKLANTKNFLHFYSNQNSQWK